jgi:serine/threonine protein kinase/TolB-like protein
MEPGTNLGHYRILEPLGKGGMGQVYLAEDTRLDRQVALKILPPELAQDRDRRERFIREAKAVAALNHPNIVVIHSVEEQDGQVFLTMERIEGAPLTHRIAGGAMPLGELFDLAIPLADAISAAHQKGIAHRDLKPDNVMITPGGVVKVLDFGLAKVVESEESMLEGAATEMLTEEGKILGTVAYMSPEQAQGKAVDGRSDIFALGILLYEMAAGRRPFEGDSKISVLSSLIKDTPAPVTEINRSLPRHLGRIIRHCLEKDPDRRYQSALDVRNELESLREEIRSGEVDLPSGEVPSLSGSVAGASMPSGLSGPHPGTMESAQHSTGAPVSATSHGSGIGDGIQATGSGSHPGMPAAPAPASGGTGRWIGIAALVALVAVAGWWALGRGEATDTAAPNVQPAAADLRQSIAVLPFDNTSGAEDVDWLRDGIAEMLSTDLSQATGLRVVGSERIREVLNELGRDADALESMDSVREVAERTGTTVVIAGSFVQAGDRLRINARLIDAATGEVTAGESVDGAGQDSVFASVDSLSRWIRGTVEPTGEVAPSAAHDRLRRRVPVLCGRPQARGSRGVPTGHRLLPGSGPARPRVRARLRKDLRDLRQPAPVRRAAPLRRTRPRARRPPGGT